MANEWKDWNNFFYDVTFELRDIAVSCEHCCVNFKPSLIKDRTLTKAIQTSAAMQEDNTAAIMFNAICDHFDILDMPWFTEDDFDPHEFLETIREHRL